MDRPIVSGGCAKALHRSLLRRVFPENFRAVGPLPREQRRWCRRAVELERAAFELDDSRLAVDARKSRFCPYPGARCADWPTALPCGRYRFCPFCAARRAAVYLGRVLDLHSRQPCRVHLRSVALGELPAGDVDALAAALEARVEARNVDTRRFRSPSLLGMLESLHVDLRPRARAWRLEARQLVATPDREASPRIRRWLEEDRALFLPADAQPRKLAAAVGWLLRYPGFLWRGDPADAVRFLRARAGLRLTESAGALRPGRDEPVHPGGRRCESFTMRFSHGGRDDS